MIEKVKELYIKYKEIINYLIFGVLTTLVNLITKYILLFTILDPTNGFQLQIAIIISWIVAVIFAYFTNCNIINGNVYNVVLCDIIKTKFRFICSNIYISCSSICYNRKLYI